METLNHISEQLFAWKHMQKRDQISKLTQKHLTHNMSQPRPCTSIVCSLVFLFPLSCGVCFCCPAVHSSGSWIPTLPAHLPSIGSTPIHAYTPAFYQLVTSSISTLALFPLIARLFSQLVWQKHTSGLSNLMICFFVFHTHTHTNQKNQNEAS